MFLLPEPAGCVWFDADEDLQKSQWRMIVDLSIVCFISPRTTSFPWCCSMFCSASSWEKLLMRSAEISPLVLLSAPVHWALLLCFAPGLGGDFDAFKTIAACPATLSPVHSFVQKTSSFEMYTTAYLTVFVCLAWLSFANFVAAVLVSNGAKCSKCSYLSFDKKNSMFNVRHMNETMKRHQVPTSMNLILAFGLSLEMFWGILSILSFCNGLDQSSIWIFQASS